MRSLSILLFILFSVSSFNSLSAQNTEVGEAPVQNAEAEESPSQSTEADKYPHQIIDPAEPESFKRPEVMPEFPGGEAGMYKFLAENIKYPAEAQKKEISGKVYARFIVDEEGQVTNAVIVRGIGGGCDAESLRVVNMMPRWSPALLDGKAVKVQYTIPINFAFH